MFRRGVILALVLLLAACGGSDVRAPFTDSRTPPSLAPADWPPPGWTWGLIQIGDNPPQRYGVTAPDAPARAQVLILPGYGAAAEDQYHLANALLAQGYAVWVLDGEGQGGSGRLTGARDLGHLKSFDPDLIAIERLVAETIRPRPDSPVILVADGAAGPLALRRLQLGAPGVAGLVLRSPTQTAPGGATASGVLADWARRFKISALRAPGGQGWSRDGPEIAPGLQPQVAHAWRMANPDLRMGGPSLGWLAAFAALKANVDGAGLGGVDIPVLILNSKSDFAADASLRQRLVGALPRCRSGQADSPADAEGQIIAFADALTHSRDIPPPLVARSPPSGVRRRIEAPASSPHHPMGRRRRRRGG